MIRIILIIPHPMCCTLDFSNINDCKSAATTFQIQSLTILVGYDSILQCNKQQQSTELLPYQSKFQPFHPTLLPLHKFIINYSTMTPTVKKKIPERAFNCKGESASLFSNKKLSLCTTPIE